MFGVDEPQTFVGYRLLLSHIEERLSGSSKWRDRVWFVNAKADGNLKGAEQRFQELWEALGSDGAEKTDAPDLGADDLDVEWVENDQDVPLASDPIPVLHVFDDSRFRGFNPLASPDLLHEELTRTVFGRLLDWFDEEITP
jgi:hypothetical protein